MKKIISLVLALFLVGCSANNSQDNIGNQSTSNQPTSQDVFTVTWKNWNGSVLYVDNDAPYGSLPTYSGQTPTREKDSQFSYTFSGWSPEVHRVYSNQDYTAVFDSEPIIPISFIYIDESNSKRTKSQAKRSRRNFERPAFDSGRRRLW